MEKAQLLSRLTEVETIAAGPRLGRMRRRPLGYVSALLFRELVYRYRKREHAITCPTFFSDAMLLLLPSGMDIYLTGGKSHPSETRLARFLIHRLRPGDTFLDIGGHYGYFSLLASLLVGEKGRVVAFEASPTTFRILEQNAAPIANFTAYHRAVSDSTEPLLFYEFPNLYAEYNTLEVEQFRGQAWFAANPPREVRIPAERMDDFLPREGLCPDLIKIDVEGAEDHVLRGAGKYLESYHPLIAMEYLSADRGNTAHLRAERHLRQLGYHPHRIDDGGQLQPVADAATYLRQHRLESDNLVFVRPQAGRP